MNGCISDWRLDSRAAQPADGLTRTRVSTLVNNPRNDESECVEAVAEEP